jgi:hypothetical protein
MEEQHDLTLTSGETIPYHDVGGDRAARVCVVRVDEHLIGRYEDDCRARLLTIRGGVGGGVEVNLQTVLNPTPSPLGRDAQMLTENRDRVSSRESSV